MTVEIVDAQDDTANGADAGTQAQPQAMTPAQVESIVKSIINKDATQANRSQVERVVAEMVAEGTSPDAIKKIMRLREAERLDDETKREADKKKESIEQFNNSLWAGADSAIGDYESAVPALKRPGTRQDMLARMSELFEKDDRFKAEQERIQKGHPPSKEAYKKAAQIAVDEFCEESGIGKKPSAAQPDLAGSVPTAQKNAGDLSLDSLNELDRKRARALINTGMYDEKSAIAQVRTNKVAV